MELGIFRPNAILHAVFVGGALLLLGWMLTRRFTSPYLRHPIAAWSVRSALLAVVVCLFPVGLAISVPVPLWLWTNAPVPQPSAGIRADSGVANQSVTANIPETEIGEKEVASAMDGNLWPSDAACVPLPEWNAVATVVSPTTQTIHPTATSTPPSSRSVPLAKDRSTTWSWDAEPWVRGLQLVYGIIVCLLLGQLLLAHWGLSRIRRSAVPASDRLRRFLVEIAGPDTEVPELKVSAGIRSPICFGLWRPVIVLPAEMTQAREEELRWILAHELDHLRRGDPWTLLWVGVCRAWFFILPWFWPLRHELTLSQEQLADAAAASSAGRSVDYAAFLVQLSAQSQPRQGVTLLAAHDVRANQSDLYRRVTMLLNSDDLKPRRRTRRWAVVAAGGMVSTALLLSTLEPAIADDKPRVKAEQKEKQPRPEGKEPLDPPRGPRDGDGPPRGPRDGEFRPGMFRPGNPGVVRELMEKLEKAVRNENMAEVRELMDRLRETMRVPGPARDPRDGDGPPRGPRDGEDRRGERPPFPPMFPVPRLERGGFDSEAIREARKALEEAMDNLKGNPDARAELKKAVENYRRAMERMGRGFGPPPRRPGGEGRPGPRLGLALLPTPEFLSEQLDLPENVGLIIGEVMPNSPAAEAGFKKHDVIVKMADKNVPSDPRKFLEVLQETRPGTAIEFEVIRRGKSKTVTAKLPEAGRVERGEEPRDRRPEGERRDHKE